jgi:hypothetical protein
MISDFEKLADAGLDPEDENPGGGSGGKWILLLLLVAFCGGLYWVYDKYFALAEPEITPAAELLIVREDEVPEPGVLPHSIDSATEFPESLDTLNKKIRKPEVRETEEGRKSIGLVIGETTTETSLDGGASFSQSIEDPIEMAVRDDSLPSVVESASDTIKSQDAPSINADSSDEMPSEVADSADAEMGKSEAPQEEVILEAVIEVDSVGVSSVPSSLSTPGSTQDVQSEASQADLEDLTFQVPDTTRDWGGLILVPDSVQLSRAFSTTVSLARIEAHPLEDGRLRVWTRIVNETDESLRVRVSCSFSGMRGQMSGVNQEQLTLPYGASIDTTFISPFNDVKGYTILVKRLF